MERMGSASFHTPSLGDEPSYQAVKAPNNPLSPYAFFFKETQTSIKQQQPDANFESVSKIVDTMWQSLDETQKEKYKKMNEADKERYFREKEAYERITGQVLPVSKVVKGHLQFSPYPIPQVLVSSSGSSNASQDASGATRCIRVGCGRPSIRNTEWEDEYCSNQCVVLHCDRVFRDWVKEQNNQGGITC